MEKLENFVSKELMSHILEREVYGFCKDNDRPNKILKTTCYMLYNGLEREDYTFTKLELAKKMKDWIRKTALKYEIPFINLYSGFDDDENESGALCILSKDWLKAVKTFYADDEEEAIFKAAQYYLETYYEEYLYQDKKYWK